jgi:DNA modification methylase
LAEDRPAHDWYRFVLSFPPHLVRTYVERFGLGKHSRVLDPFCGTGTTLVECKKLGIASAGVEANPMAHFASAVKVDWELDPDALLKHARIVAEQANEKLARLGIQDEPLPLFREQSQHQRPQGDVTLKTLDPDREGLLLADSISPLPLHKALVLRDCLESDSGWRGYQHERLAFARALVFKISNLHFGPEVGVGPPRVDAPVISAWLKEVQTMADDLRRLQDHAATPAYVHHADARQILQVVPKDSIDAVITSPPYPNEKDYTRTTRLESVLLGFLQTKADLRVLKEQLVRSNTRGVFKEDDDDQWIADHVEIQRLAQAMEERRVSLGKTSGFERLYYRVTKLYFGGMARHLAELRQVLRPGAQLAYVVGDQASFLRIMIRTGQLLADIAQSLGYEVIGTDLFRTRLATATKEMLREEVVVLRWPGRDLTENCRTLKVTGGFEEE